LPNPHPKNPFKKGDSRCKGGGRPPVNPKIKEIKQLTAEEFALQFQDLLKMSHEELYKVTKSPTATILRGYLAKCLLLGKLRGDYSTMHLMMDRIIGKVKEPKDPDQINVLQELLQAMIGAAKVAANVKK
jgi:hypothetical protein